MIFPEVQIYQPDSFEDFRGELYTLFKQEESFANLMYLNGNSSPLIL